jgi:two-component system cell cycle sensor histidine kinase/response regulator CckA
MCSVSLNLLPPSELSACATIDVQPADSNGHTPKSLPGSDLHASHRTTPHPTTAVPGVELGESFDDLIALAAQVTGAPLVILVAEGQPLCWLADSSAVVEDFWREQRFCNDVLKASDGLTVVQDTTANKHWCDHSFVRGEPRIRFFAGTPLVTADGRALGHLCVLGYAPQPLSTEQRAGLARVTRLAVTQLEAQHHRRTIAQTSLNEQRLQTLVENAPAGFVLLDIMGHATFATTAITQLMGYEMQEVIGLDMFTLIHPDDVKHPLEQFAEVICTPLAKCASEFRVLHKDGSWRWMEARAQNFLDDPSMQAVACNLWDISARKEAEAALRESESRFRRIMDSNMVGIFFWHTDGSIIDANDRFLEMTGYSRADLKEGKIDWSAMTPEEFKHLDHAGLQQLQTAGVCAPFEKEFTRKDGARLPVLVGAATLEDQPEQGVCFMIDVMDRKRMERDLLRERNLLRTLIDHIPDYIYVKDAESRYLVNNKANVTLIGVDSAETIAGKTAADFFPPDVAQVYHEDDQKVLRTGLPIVECERPTVGQDGIKRTMLATKVPLRDPSGKIIGLVGISRDITDRLALEAQLRRSQKMECIGQLAGGVAHDFNNILTVIQGHASLLVEESLTAPQRQAAQEITEAADRAANLTRQLLAFSRRNVIQPKNLDLNGTLNQMAKILQRVLGEDIALDVRYASNLPPVFADPGMFEQLVVNLAVNSRDAMPKGGRLDISLRAVALGRAEAEKLPEARPGTFVALTVSDSGCGIPREHLEHLFEPFFTTKDVGRGTGLGLATVYGIVKQHNGWISVESEVGRGTKFEIYLPASEKPLSPSAVPSKKVRGGAERILLVEDEEPLRELVRCVLESYGYHVTDAPSGLRALDVWKEHEQHFDLLLTDIVMPDGVTGRDLADALKQQKPELRVLFSSGYSSDIIGKDFVLADGVNFLQKPYNPQTLAETVRDCLDR